MLQYFLIKTKFYGSNNDFKSFRFQKRQRSIRSLQHHHHVWLSICYLFEILFTPVLATHTLSKMFWFSPVHLNNILWRIMKIFLADYSEFLVSSDFSFRPFQRISFGSVSFLVDELWALTLTQVYVAYCGLDHICAFWNLKFFYVLGVIFVGWTLLQKASQLFPLTLEKFS